MVAVCGRAREGKGPALKDWEREKAAERTRRAKEKTVKGAELLVEGGAADIIRGAESAAALELYSYEAREIRTTLFLLVLSLN